MRNTGSLAGQRPLSDSTMATRFNGTYHNGAIVEQSRKMPGVADDMGPILWGADRRIVRLPLRRAIGFRSRGMGMVVRGVYRVLPGGAEDHSDSNGDRHDGLASHGADPTAYLFRRNRPGNMAYVAVAGGHE